MSSRSTGARLPVEALELDAAVRRAFRLELARARDAHPPRGGQRRLVHKLGVAAHLALVARLRVRVRGAPKLCTVGKRTRR